MLGRALFAVIGLAAALAADMRVRAADAEALFEAKIRPVLVNQCFKCHGGEKVSNGLRVDSRAALVKGGEGGPAIVPGKPEASRLLKAIRRTDEAASAMPPDEKLPPHVVADFAAWIAAGAVWPEPASGTPKSFQSAGHWAFQPVAASVPPPDPSGWATNGIDCFIAAKRREADLAPVAPAGKRTLLRRLSFDLVGLPPTPEELAEFLADDSPGAVERVVERLLASPAYGERWGRHWMDVVRYADTAGDNADYPVPEARLYRDYIIDSFNRDLPFDQFVREQLAGDILAAENPGERYAERTIATGFVALSRRYATAPYELWHLTLEDTVDTVGRAFLGLSLRCARCHDHKFDPVTTADYYALYGIFASTQYPWAGGEEFQSKQTNRLHFVPLAPAAELAPQFAAHAERVDKLQAEITEVEKQGLDKPGVADKVKQLKGQLRDLGRTSLPGGVAGAYAVRDGSPADAAIQLKGEPRTPGPVAPRGVPKFLAAEPIAIPAGQSGRLQLAQWLTRPEHPLTARVLVNRLWQHHFGRGLVGTPSNFGLRGEAPTHPELLDYLARYFVEHGWSIKAVQRLIVTSRTYQLASEENAQSAGNTAATKDPANRLYWRHDRRRLDAEALRDAMLAVSQTLDSRRPAEHSFPPIEKWSWTQHNPFKDVYPSPHRSVYLMTQRLQKHPFLGLFDGPDTNSSTDLRSESIVPLQALFMMNSPLVKDEATAFARRLIAFKADEPQRVALAYELAYSRPPTAEESARWRDYLAQYRQAQPTAPAADVLDLEAWLSLSRILLGSNEFVFVE